MIDLSVLFARDPLSLTKSDITALIEAYRKSRHQFVLGNATAGRTKPLSAKQQKIATLADKLDIKL